MASSGKPDSGGPRRKKSRASAGKKTSAEIVKRHLSDKNDKITDADFENLEINTSLPTDEAQKPLEIEEGKERPKDSEKDNKHITPWDVISE